jgi:hypothetical protein
VEPLGIRWPFRTPVLADSLGDGPSDEATVRPLARLPLMPHMLPRDNEMRVEIIDRSGQRLPIAHGGLVVRASRDSRPVQVFVDGSGAVTNLAQVGLAGSDGRRTVLTLRCRADGGFTVTSFRQLLDS